MAVIKHELPILEYSTSREAIINPWRTDERRNGESFPKLCLMTFFSEVLDDFIQKYQGEIIGSYSSEMRDFNVYQADYKGIKLCVIQAVVAAGSVAMMSDWLYGKGVEALICCGSCGVLDKIPAGHVVVPVRALRDEGASYKYLQPSRFIEIDTHAIEAISTVLSRHKVEHIECATWTTDGFYRETKEMVEYRISEGCKVVEMECATIAAVARFRNKTFGQILYSGDILVGEEEYDDRGWHNNTSAREKLFYLSIESLCEINQFVNSNNNKL